MCILVKKKGSCLIRALSLARKIVLVPFLTFKILFYLRTFFKKCLFFSAAQTTEAFVKHINTSTCI